MPRTSRKASESGIYHVILRGINRQAIFEDDEDSACFLDIIEGYKTVSGFEVLAYCLMGNHVPRAPLRYRAAAITSDRRRMPSRMVSASALVKFRRIVERAPGSA